jgi:hypothetical protein
MTHKAAIKTEIETTSGNICKILGLSQDNYLELRYELAFEWLKNFRLPEKTLRLYLVSSTFFAWWEQSVNWREKILLEKFNYMEGPKLPNYCELIRTIPIYPPCNLIDIIYNEGLAAFARNPSLENFKL